MVDKSAWRMVYDSVDWMETATVEASESLKGKLMVDLMAALLVRCLVD